MPPVLAPAAVEQPTPTPEGRRGGYLSDAVVDLVAGWGCRYVPMTPGSSFRGLHDSLVNHAGNRDPQLILCLHEEIAVAVAHGYAKATGQVAVAAVHDLVGLMHATMAVYDAWCDRTPLLLLGGGGPADAAARRPVDWWHSATAQAQLVRDYTKWDDEPIGQQATLDAVARGHAVAGTAPCGPVYVTLDADVQEQALGPGVAVPARPPAAVAGPAAASEALAAAADLLCEARMPLVVGGRVGLRADATPLLVELVELLGGAGTDERNMVAFPTDHPQNLSGDRTVVADADVVLGVDLRDLAAFLGRRSSRDRADEVAATHGEARVIDLSLDRLAAAAWTNAGQAPAPVDVHVVAEPVHGLAQLVAAVRERVEAEPAGHRQARQDRRDAIAERHRDLRASQRAAVEHRWDDRPVAPARLVAEVWTAVRDRDWVLALRNTRTWPEGIWQFSGAGEYLGHSGGGGVGYGPGAMVGAALAARDQGRLPVAIIGDGDLLMAPGALWTAVHYQLPLLVVVNDNGSFHNDEEHQAEVARQRGRPEANAWIGMRMADPAIDLAAMARSFGAWAEGPVEDPADLGPALAQALAVVDEGGVAVVHVRTAAT